MRNLAETVYGKGKGGADRKGLSTLRSAGPGRRIPGVEVEMRPGNIRPDELPEKQRRRDRSGEGRIAGIVDVGRLAVEEAPIGLPERQAPERIVLVAGRLLEFGGEQIGRAHV